MLPAEDDAGAFTDELDKVLADDEERLLEDSGSEPGMTLELDELGLAAELDEPGMTREEDEFGLSGATDDDEGACIFAEDDETLLEDSGSVPGMTLELDELGLAAELDETGMTLEEDEFGLSGATDDDEGASIFAEDDDERLLEDSGSVPGMTFATDEYRTLAEDDDERLLEDSGSVPGMTGESEHATQANTIEATVADFSNKDILNNLKFIFKPYLFFRNIKKLTGFLTTADKPPTTCILL